MRLFPVAILHPSLIYWKYKHNVGNRANQRSRGFNVQPIHPTFICGLFNDAFDSSDYIIPAMSNMHIHSFIHLSRTLQKSLHTDSVAKQTIGLDYKSVE